jgi:hypothetical protein
MEALDVVTASSLGTFNRFECSQLVTFNWVRSFSIVRAFLVEEAKIVKKVIKSQTAPKGKK